MEENLIGYVLGALEPDAQREVEDYVRRHPEGEQRLESVRRALQPLAVDDQDADPPAGLSHRTLATIAEQQCRKLPPAPQIRPMTRPAWGRSRWRRADVLVAASILLCLGMLIPPGLSHLNHNSRRVGCTDNLREFGTALLNYSDFKADGGRLEQATFPVVAQQDAPRHVAGLFVPMLRDAGVLADNVSVRCPGNGSPVRSPWNLDELRTMDPAEFDRHAAELSGCYAYSLGYRDQDGKIQGYSRADGRVPLVSDRPPTTRVAYEGRSLNSPNHGGRGQNVLFTDGHVEFLTTPFFQGDDIFLNQYRQVAPGLDKADFILGASGTDVDQPDD